MSVSPCDIVERVAEMLQSAGVDLSDESRDYNELIAEGLGTVRMFHQDDDLRVIVYGNLSEGFEFIGPFADSDEAYDYEEERLQLWNTWTATLFTPDEYVKILENRQAERERKAMKTSRFYTVQVDPDAVRIFAGTLVPDEDGNHAPGSGGEILLGEGDSYSWGETDFEGGTFQSSEEG